MGTSPLCHSPPCEIRKAARNKKRTENFFTLGTQPVAPARPFRGQQQRACLLLWSLQQQLAGPRAVSVPGPSFPTWPCFSCSFPLHTARIQFCICAVPFPPTSSGTVQANGRSCPGMELRPLSCLGSFLSVDEHTKLTAIFKTPLDPTSSSRCHTLRRLREPLLALPAPRPPLLSPLPWTLVSTKYSVSLQHRTLCSRFLPVLLPEPPGAPSWFSWGAPVRHFMSSFSLSRRTYSVSDGSAPGNLFSTHLLALASRAAPHGFNYR